MPKQGKYAKSSRIKQIKQIRKRAHKQNGAVISDDELENFILVRFGLTSKKNLPLSVKESIQRLLIEIVNQGKNYKIWDLTSMIRNVLKKIGIRAPWQFYRQISENWQTLQLFILKEVPVVPLKKRIIVKEELSSSEFDNLVADQLAANVLLTTLGNDSHLLSSLNPQQVGQMKLSLLNENKINWDRVASAFDPIPFDVSSAPDEATKEWLQELISN